MEPFVQNLLWIIPLTLLLLAIVQVIYWLYLNSSTPSQRQNKPRHLTSPIMPTNPDNLVTHHPGNTAGGMISGQPEMTALGRVIPKLIIISGGKGHKEIKLPEAQSFGVGRFYNREYNILIALDEKSISRRHAVFRQDLTSNQFFLTDTNSSYGSSIKYGEQFQPIPPGEEERIFHNDIVQFGRALTIQFILPGETRSQVISM